MKKILYSVLTLGLLFSSVQLLPKRPWLYIGNKGGAIGVLKNSVNRELNKLFKEKTFNANANRNA